MVHAGLFINLMRKQLTSMSNLTIARTLSRKFQDLLKKDYPASRKFQDLLKKDYLAYLQQKKYLKIQKIAMSSVYGNAVITKN